MNKLEKYNGLIPYTYKRLRCFLWTGHDYRVISPEIGDTGKNMVQCKNCGKRKITIVWPCDMIRMDE